MASLFSQGGWMMWPLLALSVFALAVICERAFFFAALGFPSHAFDKSLTNALLRRDPQALAKLFPVKHGLLRPFFTELKRQCLEKNASGENGQDALDIFGQEIVARLDRFLPPLGVIVRAAPLMGLLGTVLGMINTFSKLAATQGGVDLMVLAEGIWQALITTAAGLIIAIPALLAQYWFISRKKRVIETLYRAAGAVHALRGGNTEKCHDARISHVS